MLRTSPKTSLLLLQPAPDNATARRPPRSQFRLLATHFIRQILSLSTAGDEPEIGIIGILAMLAVPGAFFSLLLFDKYSPFLRMLRGGPFHIDAYRVSLPDKYVFVACSIALTAITVAVKWERILPGPLDYAVLAPLPVRLRTIFLSNAVALAFLAALFAVDLNAIPTILFPVVVLSGDDVGPAGLLHFILVHGVCVTLATIFAFSTCLALLGALLLLVPAGLFQRISLLVRLAIVFFSCLLLVTAPQVPRLMLNPSAGLGMLKWLPSAWYAALYQCMQDRGSPQLRKLSIIGLSALIAVICIAVVGLVGGYRRALLRVPEAAKARPVWSLPIRTIMNRVFLRNGFDRAFYWFAFRILTRSEAHTVTFGAFVTLGIVIASVDHEVYSRALSVAYLLLIGFRMTLAIPAGPKAAWIHKVCSAYSDPRTVLRILAMTLLLAIVVLPAATMVALYDGPEFALLHALYILVFGTILSDCLLMHIRKPPFLSGVPKFQNRTILLITLHVLAFLTVTTLAARLELLMLRHRLSFLALPVVLALWYGIVRYLRQPASATDDVETPDVETVVQTLAIDL